MARRLFTLLSALSLLLFVGVMALWVRSYHAACVLSYEVEALTDHVSSAGLPKVERRRWGINSDRLGISCWFYHDFVFKFASEPRLALEGYPGGDPDVMWPLYRYRFLGIGYHHWESTDWRGTEFSHTWTVPYWLIVLLLALLPVLKTRTILRRRRRIGRGLCLNCGYDLRATPGRCPECGTSAVKA